MTIRLAVLAHPGGMTAVVLRRERIEARATRPAGEHTDFGERLDGLLSMIDSMRVDELRIGISPSAAAEKFINDLPEASASELTRMVTMRGEQYFINAGDLTFSAMRAADQVRVIAIPTALVELCARSATRNRISRCVLTCVSISDDPEHAVEVLARASLAAHLWIIATGSAIGEIPRARARMAIAAATIGLIAVTASPIGRLEAARWRTESSIAALQPAYRPLSALEAEANSIRRTVARMDSVLPRSTAIETLDAVTRALPSDAVLTGLSLDTAHVSLSILAASMTDVLPRLDGIATHGSTQLIGPISRERIGTADLDRATVSIPRRAR